MSVAQSSLPLALTQQKALSILDDVICLMKCDSSLPVADGHRLTCLLDAHFQEDEAGRSFRSIVCYGTPGDLVSLADFNKFIILPRTMFEFEIYVQTRCSSLQIKRLTPENREKTHSQILVYAYETLDFLVTHIFVSTKFAGDTKLFLENVVAPSELMR